MSITPIYTAGATATGGRDGKASIHGSEVHFDLDPPREMGGGGKGSNPEQLFAAGYAACYIGAMKFATTQDTSLAKVPDDAVLYPGHLYSPQPSAPMGDTRRDNFVFMPRSEEQWLAMFGR